MPIRARLILALAALLPLEAAQAQEACLTEPEVAALAGFAMPTVLRGVMKTCQPGLAPNGYLATQGAALVARYGARKTQAWPAARAAFFKLGKAEDPDAMLVLSKMPDTALQPLIEGLVGEMTAKPIDAKTCGTYERGIELLAPLPPENTAKLVGMLAALSSNKAPRPGAVPKRRMNFKVCPVQ